MSNPEIGELHMDIVYEPLKVGERVLLLVENPGTRRVSVVEAEIVQAEIEGNQMNCPRVSMIDTNGEQEAVSTGTPREMIYTMGDLTRIPGLKRVLESNFTNTRKGKLS